MADIGTSGCPFKENLAEVIHAQVLFLKVKGIWGCQAAHSGEHQADKQKGQPNMAPIISWAPHLKTASSNAMPCSVLPLSVMQHCTALPALRRMSRPTLLA